MEQDFLCSENIGSGNIPDTSEGDAGAVLILLAILIATLVAIVALGVDTSLFASQRAKYDRTAEHAALAALERYLKTAAEAGKTPQLALQDAVLRAEELSGANLEVHLSSRFRADRSKSLSDLEAITGGKLDNSVGGQNGRIFPGRWHFTAVDAANCDSPPTPFKPCFETLQDSELANAIKVELSVHDQSPLKVLFSGIMPGVHRDFTSVAVASLVPRRGVFLLDLSSSIVRDTHLDAGSPGTVSEYAFYVDPTQTTSCDPTWTSKLHPSLQPSFSALAAGPRPNGPIDPLVHYRSEFQCFNVPAVDERFGIDTVVQPEPLTSVLDSIHIALEEFERRGVSADLVGVAGFDDQILAMRKLDMVRPSSATVPEFQEFLDATDISLPIDQRLDKFLFPRLFGGQTILSGGVLTRLPAMSDVNFALRSALQMITSSPGYEVSDNFVVLISDGLGNCTQNAPACTGCTAGCYFSKTNYGRSEVYTAQALSEIAGIAQDYAQFKTALHTMLIGDVVGPHTLVRKDGAKCLSDEMARRQQPPLSFTAVSPPGTLDPTDSSPFFLPNKMYENVRDTQGLWAPIRDCCRDALGVCQTDAQDVITTACANATVPQFQPVPNSACVGVTCSAYSRWVDGNARLMCNPKGVSKRQQVIDVMAKITENNPFLLVQ